jgi:hypothetical protein
VRSGCPTTCPLSTTPLLKKPTVDSSDINYRPVSLFLSKTLERAVSVLRDNEKVDQSNQSGFKTGHSTETALLKVTQALRTVKADSLSSVFILVDLSPAFNIRSYSPPSQDWVSDALHTLRLYPTWQAAPTRSPLTSGVPQDSFLGPLVFSLYTKSLGSIIS